MRSKYEKHVLDNAHCNVSFTVDSEFKKIILRKCNFVDVIYPLFMKRAPLDKKRIDYLSLSCQKFYNAWMNITVLENANNKAPRNFK